MLNSKSRSNRNFLSYVHPKFWLILPLFVTLGGIIVVLLTRYIAYLNHPEVFTRSTTTISKTAALEYSSQFFAFSMPIIGVCVAIAWCVAYLVTHERISTLIPVENSKRLHFMNKLALTFGICSSILLVLVAIISLEDNNQLHIIFSYGFFITQVISFIIDSSILLKIRKMLGNERQRYDLGFDLRPWICLAYVVNALVFYFLYLYKADPLLADFSFIRQLYIASEYTFVFIGLSYAAAYRTELKHYVNTVFGTAYK